MYASRAICAAVVLCTCARVAGLTSLEVYNEDIVSKRMEAIARLAVGRDSNIVITYANQHHIPLLVHQSLVLDVRGDSVGTSIVVAIDHSALAACNNLGLTCVLGVKEDIPPSDFLHASYQAATFIKWRLLRTALGYFERVFIIDADVMLLRNPWPYVVTKMRPEFDLFTQSEEYYAKEDCGAKRNGGQLFAKKSSRSEKLIDWILQKESSAALDQDSINPAALAVNATVCSLDSDLFVGHCFQQHVQTPLSKIFTYHAHCLTNAHDKLSIVRQMTKSATRAALNTAYDVPVSRFQDKTSGLPPADTSA